MVLWVCLKIKHLGPAPPKVPNLGAKQVYSVQLGGTGRDSQHRGTGTWQPWTPEKLVDRNQFHGFFEGHLVFNL